MEPISEKFGLVTSARPATATVYGPAYADRYPVTRLQKWATSLLKLHYISPQDLSAGFAPLDVVCISDIRSTRPAVPVGDVLVHTGNLSSDNSIGDIQAQLSWLSSLPHTHKIIIAGDQDSHVLDQAWSARELSQRSAELKQGTQAMASTHLDFGNVIYLHDSGVTLNFVNNRQISIFGSPSPCKDVQLGCVGGKNARVWRRFIPRDVDILLTNEYLYHQVDTGVRHANLRLVKQLIWSRPKMVVSRGLGASADHGAENVVFDGVRGEYEGIMAGVDGYDGLYRMWVRVLVKRTGYGLRKMLCLKPFKDQRTKLVESANQYSGGRDLDAQAVVVHV